MTEYSAKAQILVDRLSGDEVEQIRKHNPFRIERNDKIRSLYQRGVSQVVIAEVSGLSGMSISKICADIQREKRAERI